MDIADVEVVVVYGISKTATELYQVVITNIKNFLLSNVSLCSCLAVLVAMGAFLEAICSIASIINRVARAKSKMKPFPTS